LLQKAGHFIRFHLQASQHNVVVTGDRLNVEMIRQPWKRSAHDTRAHRTRSPPHEPSMRPLVDPVRTTGPSLQCPLGFLIVNTTLRTPDKASIMTSATWHTFPPKNGVTRGVMSTWASV